jgi:hypothetical protein
MKTSAAKFQPSKEPVAFLTPRLQPTRTSVFQRTCARQSAVTNEQCDQCQRGHALLPGEPSPAGTGSITPRADREAGSGVAWDFGNIPVFSTDQANGPGRRFPLASVPNWIQAKLFVGQANDPLEHEADRVADLVTHGSLPGQGSTKTHRTGLNVQRQEDEQPSTTSTSDDTDDNPIAAQIEMLLEQEGIQTKAAGEANVTPGFETMLSATKGEGQAMPGPARAEMENAFGADFSGVRLHTDADAVQMNRQVGAYAFTHGQDIYFNEGCFDPSAMAGKHLLAHELTHTLQQGGDKIQRLKITPTQFTPLDCGGRDVRWIFALDAPAPSDGYFVQWVRFFETSQKCPSKVGSLSMIPTDEYWEFWEVTSGETNESKLSEYGYTDKSTRPPAPKQNGCQVTIGTVKFFPRSVTGDLGPRVDPLSVRKVPPSGDLPFMRTQPSWWNTAPTEGPASRWALSWWNCCGPAESNFSNIDADPRP